MSLRIGIPQIGMRGVGSLVIPLPLDNLSAAAAYSLRKLRTAYTGAAIRVRNDFLLEADIPFSPIVDASGNYFVSTTALLSHCGSGSGFVTSWYDQSGNSRDAVQTTAANQPRIVNAGVVFFTNGKPSIEYLGAQWLRFTSTTNVFVGSIGAAIVFSVAAGTGVRIISLVGPTGMDWNTAGNALFARPGGGGNAVELFSNAAQRALGSYAIGTLAQGSLTLGTSFAIWINGTSGTASSGNALNSRTLTIGASETNEGALTGAVSEFISFPSELSTPDRQSLERNQGAAYGITVT